MTKEALKLALEALETLMIERGSIYDKAITAIKEALANEALEKMAENARELGLDYGPAKEPVAWEQFYPDMGKPQLALPHPWEKFCDSNCVWTDHHPDCKLAERKPLSDEEIQKCYETTGHYQTLRPQDRFAVFALARAIEAAHGIKGEA